MGRLKKLYKTKSATETKKVAKMLAEIVQQRPSQKHATVVLLKGDLGAGKTTFIQGVLRGLGVKKKIVSPTFTLVRSYVLKTGVFTKAYHFDCYRIADETEVQALGFTDLLKDPHNILFIEWPEHIRKILPRKVGTVTFSYGKTLNERTIEIQV